MKIENIEEYMDKMIEEWKEIRGLKASIDKKEYKKKLEEFADKYQNDEIGIEISI